MSYNEVTSGGRPMCGSARCQPSRSIRDVYLVVAGERPSASSARAASKPMKAPHSCAAMNGGTLEGAIPANVSLSERPTVIAGLAKEVEAGKPVRCTDPSRHAPCSLFGARRGEYDEHQPLPWRWFQKAIARAPRHAREPTPESMAARTWRAPAPLPDSIRRSEHQCTQPRAELFVTAFLPISITERHHGVEVRSADRSYERR